VYFFLGFGFGGCFPTSSKPRTGGEGASRRRTAAAAAAAEVNHSLHLCLAAITITTINTTISA
jgi:hypothetical protein